MRKFQAWEEEVWDYRSKEEADNHKSKKFDSGFRVTEEYENPDLYEDGKGYTVLYKRIKY